MENFRAFCKPYFFEILFALGLSTIVGLAEKDMMLYFILFIISTAVFITLVYLVVVNVKVDNNYDEQVAINLFKARYGCEPKDKGFSAITFYKRYKFYIYASSSEVLSAYKLQQRILYWIVKGYLWGWLVILIALIIAIISSHNVFHTSCLSIYVFAGFWIMLYRSLDYKIRQTERLIEVDKTIAFVNENKD